MDIREIDDSTRGEAAALFSAAYPLRIAEVERWTAPDPGEGAERWTVAEADEVIAYAALWRVQRQRFRMDLVVRDDRRCRHIGTPVLEHLLERAHRRQAVSLQARTDGDAAGSVAFLQRRHFVETMRMHRYIVDVAHADLARFDGLMGRLTSGGISITTLAGEERSDPDCWRKLCDLHNAAQEGWPDPDPGDGIVPLRIDDLRRMWAKLGVASEHVLLATDGSDYLGFSGSAGTAVRPSARNRGIATALKVSVVQRARTWTRDAHERVRKPCDDSRARKDRVQVDVDGDPVRTTDGWRPSGRGTLTTQSQSSASRTEESWVRDGGSLGFQWTEVNRRGPRTNAAARCGRRCARRRSARRAASDRRTPPHPPARRRVSRRTRSIAAPRGG